jgi:hypothetical protein
LKIFNIRYIFITLCMVHATLTHAEPWYSGPLLSDPAIVTPIGHGFFQMYFYKTSNYGDYNDLFKFDTLPLATTKEIDARFNYGLTKNTEMQAFVTYLNNKTEHRQAGHLGDTTLTLSAQLSLQHDETWPPSVKFMFRQLFPTGRYDNLDENLLATDATGQGSYLTMFALNMEHITNLGGQHNLVEFATVTVTLASPMTLKGHSLYGGGAETSGTLWPGNSIAFNLAAEYAPDQHWGFIIETFIYAQEASKFHGNIGPTAPRFTPPGIERPDIRPGRRHNRHTLFLNRRFRPGRVIFNNLRPSALNLGGFEGIGHGHIAGFTLIPAIGYSFTKNTSITGGVWLTVAGKNTPAFYTPMLRFTSNW